jgi:hypothetical protein
VGKVIITINQLFVSNNKEIMASAVFASVFAAVCKCPDLQCQAAVLSSPAMTTAVSLCWINSRVPQLKKILLLAHCSVVSLPTRLFPKTL